MENKNKYRTIISELTNFLEQGEEINIKEFEDWKTKLIEGLSDNYKIRFSSLEFYSINEEQDYSEDDLPF